MTNWRDDFADQNLRMAQKMLEQQGEVNAARAEVAALRQQLDEARDLLEASKNLHANAEHQLAEARADRDRLLVVYRAAEAWREYVGSDQSAEEAALIAAVDAYRSAAPAEPAPGDLGDVPVDSAYAAGVAAGRAQVLAVLRDDGLYHEWNRQCGMDPAGARSTVDAVQRHVMHDFAEWATGGEPRG